MKEIKELLKLRRDIKKESDKVEDQMLKMIIGYWLEVGKEIEKILKIQRRKNGIQSKTNRKFQ